MLAKEYMNKGLSRKIVLSITRVTRHQLYYKMKESNAGRLPSVVTKYKDNETQEITKKPNTEVVDQIIKIKQDPD